MANPKSLVVQQIEQLAAPILQEHQAELVDLQYVHERGQWVLRFFLEKGTGITLEDCAMISEHLGRVLDASDVIPQSYSLEVSSPGIYRRLNHEKDYQRFIGERVEVTLWAPLNGRRHFKGTIQSVQEGAVSVLDYTQQVIALPLSGIAKANLDPDLKI